MVDHSLRKLYDSYYPQRLQNHCHQKHPQDKRGFSMLPIWSQQKQHIGQRAPETGFLPFFCFHPLRNITLYRRRQRPAWQLLSLYHFHLPVSTEKIITQGSDVADAMEMARDAIGVVGIDMQDDGEQLPEPSQLSKTRAEYAEATVTLIDVDFDEYRRQNDLRAVKKNCTIPSWLNTEAERAGVNFSLILQNGLKDYLRLSAPRA
jgi:predicted RNase H-like HicB family nuclease